MPSYLESPLEKYPCIGATTQGESLGSKKSTEAADSPQLSRIAKGLSYANVIMAVRISSTM